MEMILNVTRKSWSRFRELMVVTLLTLFSIGLQSHAFASSLSNRPNGSKISPANSINQTNSSSVNRAHYFKFKQKINPVWWFGNADEPVAPAWYRPGKHNRNLAWHLRNPFHNFDGYVIGVSDKSFTR